MLLLNKLIRSRSIDAARFAGFRYRAVPDHLGFDEAFLLGGQEVHLFQHLQPFNLTNIYG